MPDANEQAERAKTSGLAIASLTLSCLSVLIGPFGFIPGIICGRIAQEDIRKNPNLSGDGIARAGLIVGYVFLALTVLWFIAVIGFVFGPMLLH